MKAVFLDRDGGINRKLDHDYVKCWDEFEFLPQSLAAICMLTEAEYQLIIVTNQACINKGIISHSQLAEIHRRMIEKIERTDGKICDIYYSPHRPDENSEYRKPKPGMFLKAKTKHNIDMEKSWLIGDKEVDVIAANEAGIENTILVRSGHRIDESNSNAKIILDSIRQAKQIITE